MRSQGKRCTFTARRAGRLALAAIMAGSLSFPQLALATVRVDETELAQGENAVGGGTATLKDSLLDMVDVTAFELCTDEDLAVNFNGGNDIEVVDAEGSAQVDLSFSGENAVEEVHAFDDAAVTINANGTNEFEEIQAWDRSSIAINVTGENEFEDISALDDASITLRGTECQKKDIVNLGEDEEDANLITERGALVIDHVTVNLEAEQAMVGSDEGDVTIDTSKVASGDDNEYAYLTSGGDMEVRESVIDITGTVHAAGEMTIEHSDVEVDEPDAKFNDESPYRVWSETSITLIDQKNGEVKDGIVNGKAVKYVDTDDNDGKSVDLEADGDPDYYHCASERPSGAKALPVMGDVNRSSWPMTLAAGVASLAVGLFMSKRRAER